MELGQHGNHGAHVVPRAQVVTGRELEYVTTQHRPATDTHVPAQTRKRNNAMKTNLVIYFTFHLDAFY